MTDRWLIKFPLFVIVPRVRVKDQKRIINLNNYRNWNRFTEGDIKKIYTAMAVPKLKEAGVLIPDGFMAVISYRMFKVSLRNIDRFNVLSIHCKYAEDAMTAAGCFPDDNDSWIDSQHFYSGGLDRTNPRVEMLITMVARTKTQPDLFDC